VTLSASCQGLREGGIAAVNVGASVDYTGCGSCRCTVFLLEYWCGSAPWSAVFAGLCCGARACRGSTLW